jgi:hypothetical protein
MKGHHCADIQVIKTTVTEQLHSIPESAFWSRFSDLQKRWQRCIDAGETISKGQTAIM